MRLFDSHAHYDDARFDDCREQVLSEVLAAGVERIVNPASNLVSSDAAVLLAKTHPAVYAAVGVHPSDAAADCRDSAYLTQLRTLYEENEKVAAIGEIGLDYYYGKDDKDIQLRVFREQMALAASLGAPVIIHDRDAHADTLDVLADFPNVTCVVHSFSGSVEMAKEIVKNGHYFSVNGVLTFKHARKTVELLERIDELPSYAIEHILLETDCPYLAPEPFRGRLNRSDYMVYTAQKAASVLGMTAEEFADVTYRNACRFYRLDDKAKEE